MTSRRSFLRSISQPALIFSASQILAAVPVPFRFTNVAHQAGLRHKTIFGGDKNNQYLLETTGCGVAFFDYDNDGWLDVFFVNGTRLESDFPAGEEPVSRLYRNNRDGTLRDGGIESGVAYSPDGKSQAGMGVGVADYDHDGNLDIVKTNFAGDTSSLYRNLGERRFEDMTFQSGIGKNTRFLGWGAGFADFDNDGFPDILLSNGHVYPEVNENHMEHGYHQPKVVYHNRGDGRFEDITSRAGSGATELVAARGCAFGDFDNDGHIDVVVNCINQPPQLLHCESSSANNWITLKLVGVASNRSGIGARAVCRAPKMPVQFDEVRSGGSYLSQNDMRLHFGLGSARECVVEVQWPSGAKDQILIAQPNQVVTIIEGSNPSSRGAGAGG